MSGHEIGAWEHELAMARVRGGEALQGPERAIRAAHAPKDAALDQIRAAGAEAGVGAEAEAGVVSTAIRPSRLRRPPR